jgi:DeoR family transcriptional regulator of aga operon
MRSEQRLIAILESLEKNEHVSTKALSDELQVTQVTVRSDLKLLENQGKIVRVFGGALVANRIPETAHEQRSEVDHYAKVAIANKAAELLGSQMTVVLDVGTSTFELAKQISSDSALHSMTIVTNGLQIALALEKAIPRNDVVVTGGLLRPIQHSLVHSGATEVIERFRSSYCFIGCDGIDPVGGATTTNLPEADLKEAMRKNADRSVLLAAGSKLGKIANVKINEISAFDTLITSEDADPKIIEALRAQGLEVIVAPLDKSVAN